MTAIAPAKRILLLAFALSLACMTAIARSPQTGIAGQSFLPPQIHCFGVDCPGPEPVPTTITVLTETGEFVTKVATDAEGNFAVSLKPGIYQIVPEIFTWTLPPSGSIIFGFCRLYASPFQVTVEKKVIASVEVRYAYYCVD